MKRSFCLIKVLTVGPSEPGSEFYLEVETSFSQEWIDGMKAAIRSADRFWDEEKKRWYVKGRHFETLEKLALTHFQTAEVEEVEFSTVTDLRSGTTRSQGSLF